MLTSAQGGRPHCGLVTHNETWNENDSPHLVTCDVVLRNSRLTIDQGATVLMGDGASLIIQSGSELVARGAPEAQIRIEPAARDEVPGSWGQVRLEAGAKTSAVDYVTFFGGGAGRKPMVEVHSGALIINHSRFQKALAAPLAFAANAVGPSLGVAGPGPARQACNLVQFANNGENAIRVLTDLALDVTDSQTWYDFCLPYRVDGEMTVAGADSPTLSLEQGALLQFDAGAGLTAGYSMTATGQFETNGSPDLPVVLTGADTTPGSWRGVTISRFGSGSSSLFGLRLEYGGAGPNGPGSTRAAMLTVARPDTLAGGGLVFAHGAGYPLAAHAGAINGLASGLVGAPGGNFVANGIQRVLVLADLDNPDISRSAEWPGLGVPYDVQGDLTIARPQPPAILTLGEGVELIFDGQETLSAGDTILGQGGFRAIGSPGSPVILRGEQDAPGSWGGLDLRRASTAELQDAHLSGAGAGDRPMLDWGSPKGGRVARTTFEKAAGYPVRVPIDAAEVFIGSGQLDESERNRFDDNGLNRILLSGLMLGDRAQRWADPGIPVEVEGSLRVQPVKALTATLTLVGGINLRFEPYATLSIGEDQGAGHGALVVPGEDEALTVDIGPVDQVAGWSGLIVNDTGRLRARRLSVWNTGQGDALRLYGPAEFDGGVSVSAGLSETASAIGLYGSGWPKARLTGQGLVIGPATTGIHLSNPEATVNISRSVFTGVTAWAIRNDSPQNCVNATLVYWGDASGPRTDPSPEACAEGHANPTGRGGRLSPGVNWWPFALDPTAFTPSSATPSPTPTPPSGEGGRIFMPLAWR